MGWEANVPSGFWPKVQKLIDDSIAKALRGGPLRNARITGGAGLTIAEDGSLQLETSDGTVTFYVGPLLPNKADGTGQQGLVLRREDGSLAMALYDPNPLDNFRQFLALYDRAGNIIMSDDTESGQGVARPYIPLTFYPAIMGVVPSTTSSTFTPLWRSTGYKQQPQVTVGASAALDTAGATGELRVMVNNVQLGATQTVTSAAGSWVFGPAAVAGAHMSGLTVEIQARRTSATGTLYAVPASGSGLQS